MSIKCKIFVHHISRVQFLERQINEFLEENGAAMVNTTQCSDESGNITITIFCKYWGIGSRMGYGEYT